MVNFQESNNPSHADMAVAECETLQAINGVELIVAAATIDCASKGPVTDVDGLSEAPERSKSVGFIEDDEHFAGEHLLFSIVNTRTKL